MRSTGALDTDELEQLKRQPVTSVPIAGRVFYSLGETAAYAAARRGEIPTLRLGRKLVVPVAKVLRDLGIAHDG